MNVAFHIWVICWLPGKIQPTFRPFRPEDPAVTVNWPWKPPDQLLITEYAAVSRGWFPPRGLRLLRHQITVPQRQLGTTRPRFSPGDRAFLAALLHRLPRSLLGRRPLSKR